MTERLGPPDTARFPRLVARRDLHIVPASHLLGRIYFAGGDHPAGWDSFRRFGPTTSRFDHHPPPARDHPSRAIAYGAVRTTPADREPVSALETCLLEVFRDTGVVDTHTGSPYFALFRVQRQVRLLDVVDSTWVTLAGGNAAICSGSRARAREWSRAIYGHYRTIDGIFYGGSTLPPARAVALFERARSAMPSRPELNLPLSHPGLGSAVGRACDRFRLPLI